MTRGGAHESLWGGSKGWQKQEEELSYESASKVLIVGWSHTVWNMWCSPVLRGEERFVSVVFLVSSKQRGRSGDQALRWSDEESNCQFQQQGKDAHQSEEGNKPKSCVYV